MSRIWTKNTNRYLLFFLRFRESIRIDKIRKVSYFFKCF
ncbi:conserved hypothetical protein, partial [Listeria seeligeri FSL S4-171]